MKAVFGLLSLVLVLVIVGSVAKKQLQALGGGVSTRASTAAGAAPAESQAPGSRDGATLAVPGGMPGATGADTTGLTLPQQSNNLQQRFRDDTARALQQGADRNARAAP